MRTPTALRGPLLVRRPVLRAQLTLLYAGVFVTLVVALFLASSVLFGTANVFFGHSTQAFHPGQKPGTGAGTRSFDLGPFLVAVAAIALAIFVAWWLAGRFLRPLRAMTATAQEISASNLGRRLSVRGPDDELTELGRTLNDLFARLQASFDSQRQFVANASHELRTPLAGQRTLLQVALADPAADGDLLRSACAEALELSAQQERLIEALLTLATSERGLEQRETIALSELVQQVVANHQGAAAGRAITLTSSLGPATVTGDPDLIRRLVANLIDNAILHNHDGGEVAVRIGSTSERSQLTVINSGPPLAAEDLASMFVPFRRLGVQRVRSGSGHGLGLAIVKAIADAHGADVAARPRPGGGLELTVSFPGS